MDSFTWNNERAICAMKWDYIVIGAGSAGCALASELVKSGQTVLVIEAGGSDRSLFIKIPAGELRAAAKYDWGYYSQPDLSRNGIRQRWLRGRVLGGSSSINGMIYVRGAVEDFDRWSARCGGAGGWSAQEIMPLFREIETSDQANLSRGQSGPLHVRTVKKPHAISQAFISSACAAGYPFNEDYNSGPQEGVSYIQFSQRRGLRCSSADAFLKPLLGRSNLKLLLNASVDKIEMSNGHAGAVVFQHEGQQRREMARDIILCAGAINSPKLLMLSGIGDAQELKRHNVGVALHLPGVGSNLQDHPLLYLAYRTKIPTYNPTEGFLQKIAMAANFLFSGEGPISNPFEATAFLKSSAAVPTPDLQLFFSPVGVFKMLDGSFNTAPFPGITVAVAHSYPISTGRVRLASHRPNDPPLIEYTLLENQADVDIIVQGFHTIRRIMSTDPIAALVEEQVVPGPEVNDLTTLTAFIRKTTSICFHSIGTCRMGEGADSVVSPELRVHGTDNLWIADASVIPAPISANMNASCMMIGLKLGKQLAARR